MTELRVARALGPYDGGPTGRFLAPFFTRIAVRDEEAQRLERAHAEGTVVHVFRSQRVLDPLYLLHALAQLGLPQPEWMHGHIAARAPDSVDALVAAVKRGEPSVLFLRRPKTLADPRTGYTEGHVEALIEAQRQLDRPILLLPESLHWARASGGLRRTLIDVLFGDRVAPGKLREISGFLLRYGSAYFHVGAPVNLASVLEREGDTPTPIIAKKIRWSMLNHLTREEEIRGGPISRPTERTLELVLKDPAVQKHLPPDQPAERRRGLQIMRRLAADVRYGWIRVLDAIIDRIWNEIYDGINVDQDGLAKVWNAARRGPVVLVPSHKSHVDYLVLSQVFFKDGLMPPHIAAGDNLSFWPLGYIFRRSGAFFIRRSFSGDKLYAALCAAYVRRLLKDGHAVEFFIEGGRSRSGKLLQPKMGLLGMCVDPVLDGAIQDVSFIPVSISYEKIIEARSYSRELEGGEKTKENVGALLSSRKILRSRFGRVYVDFDEPLSLRAFAAARGVELKARPELSEAPREELAGPRRDLTQQLGHRIVWGINRVTRVTPTGVAATVMLGQTARGIGGAELMRRADRVIALYTRLGARVSTVLAPDPSGELTSRHLAIRTALGRLAQDGVLMILPARDEDENVYELDERGRRALDFYRNNIVHFVVPLAIVVVAVLGAQDGDDALAVRMRADAPTPGPAPADGWASDVAVRARARGLSRLLKHEFSFSVDADFDANFDAAARVLVDERVLSSHGGQWQLTARGAPYAQELAQHLAPFFEAYRAAVEILNQLDAGPRPEKDVVADALRYAQRQAGEGRIRRGEAASQPTLQNAIKVAVDVGALTRGEGKVAWPAEGRGALERLAVVLDAELARLNRA
jgi:glycerol-3-phosphate O-acyltransferase